MPLAGPRRQSTCIGKRVLNAGLLPDVAFTGAIDASIYQSYLDQVTALIPGATRRRVRTSKGTDL